MNNPQAHVVAIGAANIDIQGFPEQSLYMRDSNPGRIKTCLGGVARNIAENLVRLGVPVDLITAFGDDAGGRAIASSCRELGISLEHALEVAGHSSSTYIAIMDEEGDMALGLSDLGILDLLGPDHLQSCAPLLAEASAIVLDAGLPTESMRWLTESFPDRKTYIDPVSVGKCRRMQHLVGGFYCVKMNRMEASFLADLTISDDRDLDEAASRLLAKGLQKLYITLGADGVYFAQEGERGRVPAVSLHPVNATGAGDAFTAAALYGDLQGWEMERCARFAVGAAALALLSRSTVSERISVAAVEAVECNSSKGD